MCNSVSIIRINYFATEVLNRKMLFVSSDFLQQLRNDLHIDLTEPSIRYNELSDLYGRFCNFFASCQNPESEQVKLLVLCCLQYINCIQNYIDNAENVRFETIKEFISVVEEISELEGANDIWLQYITIPIFKKVTEPDIKSYFAKEILRRFNSAIKGTRKDIRYMLVQRNNLYLCKLADLICTCGDFDYQSILLETIFHMCTDAQIIHYANEMFPTSSEFENALCRIDKNNFDTDCRVFLNLINSELKKVLSLKCTAVQLGNKIVSAPKVPDQGELPIWVDFNLGTQTITIAGDKNSLRSGPPSETSDDDDGWELITINVANIINVCSSRFMVPDSAVAVGCLIKFTMSSACSFRHLSSAALSEAKQLKLAIYKCPELNELVQNLLPLWFSDNFKQLTPMDTESLELHLKDRQMRMDSTNVERVNKPPQRYHFSSNRDSDLRREPSTSNSFSQALPREVQDMAIVPQLHTTKTVENVSIQPRPRTLLSTKSVAGNFHVLPQEEVQVTARVPKLHVLSNTVEDAPIKPRPQSRVVLAQSSTCNGENFQDLPRKEFRKTATVRKLCIIENTVEDASIQQKPTSAKSSTSDAQLLELRLPTHEVQSFKQTENRPLLVPQQIPEHSPLAHKQEDNGISIKETKLSKDHVRNIRTSVAKKNIIKVKWLWPAKMSVSNPLSTEHQGIPENKSVKSETVGTETSKLKKKLSIKKDKRKQKKKAVINKLILLKQQAISSTHKATVSTGKILSENPVLVSGIICDHTKPEYYIKHREDILEKNKEKTTNDQRTIVPTAENLDVLEPTEQVYKVESNGLNVNSMNEMKENSDDLVESSPKEENTIAKKKARRFKKKTQDRASTNIEEMKKESCLNTPVLEPLNDHNTNDMVVKLPKSKESKKLVCDSEITAQVQINKKIESSQAEENIKPTEAYIHMGVVEKKKARRIKKKAEDETSTNIEEKKKESCFKTSVLEPLNDDNTNDMVLQLPEDKQFKIKEGEKLLCDSEVKGQIQINKEIESSQVEEHIKPTEAYIHLGLVEKKKVRRIKKKTEDETSVNIEEKKKESCLKTSILEPLNDDNTNDMVVQLPADKQFKIRVSKKLVCDSEVKRLIQNKDIESYQVEENIKPTEAYIHMGLVEKKKARIIKKKTEDETSSNIEEKKMESCSKPSMLEPLNDDYTNDKLVQLSQDKQFKIKESKKLKCDSKIEGQIQINNEIESSQVEENIKPTEAYFHIGVVEKKKARGIKKKTEDETSANIEEKKKESCLKASMLEPLNDDNTNDMVVQLPEDKQFKIKESKKRVCDSEVKRQVEIEMNSRFDNLLEEWKASQDDVRQECLSKTEAQEYIVNEVEDISSVFKVKTNKSSSVEKMKVGRPRKIAKITNMTCDSEKIVKESKMEIKLKNKIKKGKNVGDQKTKLPQKVNEQMFLDIAEQKRTGADEFMVTPQFSRIKPKVGKINSQDLDIKLQEDEIVSITENTPQIQPIMEDDIAQQTSSQEFRDTDEIFQRKTKRKDRTLSKISIMSIKKPRKMKKITNTIDINVERFNEALQDGSIHDTVEPTDKAKTNEYQSIKEQILSPIICNRKENVLCLSEIKTQETLPDGIQTNDPLNQKDAPKLDRLESMCVGEDQIDLVEQNINSTTIEKTDVIERNEEPVHEQQQMPESLCMPLAENEILDTAAPKMAMETDDTQLLDSSNKLDQNGEQAAVVEVIKSQTNFELTKRKLSVNNQSYETPKKRVKELVENDQSKYIIDIEAKVHKKQMNQGKKRKLYNIDVTYFDLLTAEEQPPKSTGTLIQEIPSKTIHHNPNKPVKSNVGEFLVAHAEPLEEVEKSTSSYNYKKTTSINKDSKSSDKICQRISKKRTSREEDNNNNCIAGWGADFNSLIESIKKTCTVNSIPIKGKSKSFHRNRKSHPDKYKKLNSTTKQDQLVRTYKKLSSRLSCSPSKLNSKYQAKTVLVDLSDSEDQSKQNKPAKENQRSIGNHHVKKRGRPCSTNNAEYYPGNTPTKLEQTANTQTFMEMVTTVRQDFKILNDKISNVERVVLDIQRKVTQEYTNAK